MFSLSLFTLGLATISAYAKPVRTAGGLKVFLSTPADNVPSATDLRIIATVKNVGDKDLEILKFGTVLDFKHHVRSFTVGKDGKEVPFIGIEVPTSTGHISENDRVIIRAGKDVSVEQNALALYDFSASGSGTFTFNPVSGFQVIGPNDTIHTEIADAHPLSITITNNVPKRELKLEKRQSVDCGNKDHYSTIAWGVIEARIMANEAVEYIRNHFKNDDDLVKKYFGPDSDPNSIILNFYYIVNSNDAQQVLSCSDPKGMCSGTRPAYHPRGTDHSVYYCSPFYDQRPIWELCQGKIKFDSRNLRGATSLRFLAQALIPGVKESGLDCSVSSKFKENPIWNDHNYECFAAEVHSKTMC